MTQTEYEQLRSKVERAARKSEQAKGAYAQSRATLKERWGVENVKEAKEMLAALTEELQNIEQELSTATEEFERKWSEYLSNA